MCGRFTQLFTYAELHEFWRSFTDPLPTLATNMQPRWHLCPTDPIWTITHSEREGTKLEHVRWGLAPFWWKTPLKKLPATFNARAETVAEKPMFREAFKYRRAIIPASGWHEWQQREDGKQPWYFTPAKEPIALIAALWETCLEDFADASFARIADMGHAGGRRAHASSPLGRVHGPRARLTRWRFLFKAVHSVDASDREALVRGERQR